MSELTLVPIVRTLEPISTAVMYKGEARSYLRVSWPLFRKLERAATINRYHHIDGGRPFYLKHELDAYLRSLPRVTMPQREFPESSERSE